MDPNTLVAVLDEEVISGPTTDTPHRVPCAECRSIKHKLSCSIGATLALGGNPEVDVVRSGVLVSRSKKRK